MVNRELLKFNNMEDFGKYRYIIDDVCRGKKAENIVPKIIPILVYWAQKGETDHTYNDLIRELGYKKFSGIGYQLGYVADIIHQLCKITHKDIPTLNSLIRSTNSNLPSSGFSHVLDTFNELPKGEKIAIVKNKNEEAITYSEWDWVLDILGLKPWQDDSTSFFPDNIDENKTYYEGATKKVLVNKYERSRDAREKCILLKGCRCAVCGMDFEKEYGAIGKGFIHIHHIIPINSIGKDYVIDCEKDLVPVCPNCHAMLHRNNPPYTIEELKLKIAETNNQLI